jgi:hypothetical protein
MKTTIKLTVLLAICLGLCSCATYNVTFFKALTTQPKVQSVYVFVNDSLGGSALNNTDENSPNYFMKKLSGYIGKALTNNGIKNTLKIYSSVYSLETLDDITTQINNLKPDAIITVKREHTTLGASKYGLYYGGGTYSISVSSSKTSKVYWKSVIDTSNESGFMESDYESIIKQLIDKIKQDGIM